MDKTIMIPTPGAARSQEAGHGSNTGTSGSMEFDANGLQGLNPLVSSASVLLTLLNELRSTMQYSNVPGLHQKLTEEIRLFERNTQVNRLSNESMLLARYLLCTALDETVLNTPRSEEHTSELQSRPHLVCRLLLEKKKKIKNNTIFNLLTTR